MNKLQKFWRLLTIAAMLVSALNLSFVPVVSARPADTVSLTNFSTYSQNFDALANTGITSTWTNDVAPLIGWYAAKSVAPNDITSYRIDAGGANSGAIYSYGTGAATERALGSVSSGTPGTIYYGIQLTNNTSSTIAALNVSYTGEQWRNGGNTSAQTLAFHYQIGATSLITGTWTPVSALDFVTPIVGATAVALDGNAASNWVALSSSITGLSIPPGETIWLRWMDINDAGNDHGVSIDDLTITPVAALPTLSVNDISVTEGNSGPTTATFTIDLSASSTSDVTFDVETSDGTATLADSDYVQVTTTPVTITAGNISTTFNVTVNGDTNIESDEAFNLKLSNPSGATIADDTGVGTITNDDFPTYSLSINDVSVTEGNSGTTNARFMITLSTPAPVGGVTFDIETADDSATDADNDYEPNLVKPATIATGDTIYTFDVTVNGDTNVETDETFKVLLSNATGATIIDDTGVGTITNDDLGLSINDVTVTEGNANTTTASFTVTLNGVSTSDVTFNIATEDGIATTANNDYVAKSITPATIATGDTTYTFGVTVNGDWDNEANETFLVNVTDASGATVTDGQGQGTITNDDNYTHIYDIQGTGSATTYSGTQTIQGIVVGDYEGGVSPQIRGFYVQEAPSDGNTATSDGIFVFNASNNNVNLGDLVRVTGTVSEYQGQTQVSASSISVLSSGNTIIPTDISLPFASLAEEEQYEGMLVRVPQTLYVTEIYQLGRFNQITMSGSSRLTQPTNIAVPGAPAAAMQAANDLNKIIVDDALNTENPDPIVFGRGGNPLSASNTLRGGDTIANMVGIFTYTWGGNSSSPNAYRIRPINAMGGGIPNFVPANARPTTAPAVGGTLKVVGMNLLNYFNSFTNCIMGVSDPTPNTGDCRGAENSAEFTRQSAKTVAAITKLNADVIGFAEMENDGYGVDSAIYDLVSKLNTATAPGTYAFINVDSLTGKVDAMGSDAIKVGFIYKPASVTPTGITSVLDTMDFVGGGDGVARNRVSLLQAFKQNSNNEIFLASINHLKSKGSACNAPDAGDGQGNCSIVRTNAVNVLTTWLNTDPTGTGDPDIVILGDLNSYAKEDPISAFQDAGYINMIEHFDGADAYSYVFDGQWGYLDHALGSDSLLAQTTDVADWHINSDEPSVLDYNTNYKTAGQQTSLYNADEYRISDHDPVVVGLNLNQNTYTLTINSAHGTVTKSPNQATYHYGDVVQLSITPDDSWKFANWTGDLTGSNNPGSITIHGNTSITANYVCDSTDVSIAGASKGSYCLTAGQSTRQNYDANNGPVKVSTVNTPIIAAERVNYFVGSTVTSYSEMMGLPDGQLDTTYWFPWYKNDSQINTQLRIGNVSGTTAHVHVYIAGVEMAGSPYTLTASGDTQSVRLSYAANAGPVKIVSDQNIVASERVNYFVGGTVTSYAEIMGLPNSQLDKTYWFPWYKNDSQINTQLRIANVSGATAHVHVYIAGAEMAGSPYTLTTSGDTQSMRLSFAANAGPVKIVSDQNIVASERVNYFIDGVVTSYSEMMGLPNAQLDTTFWFPWYKNDSQINTQLRIANVSGTTAHVHVYIGTTEMPGSPFTLTTTGDAQSVRLSFTANDGPVKIVSDQNIVASERVNYFVGSTVESYAEMMGLPNSQLNKTYWFPWYKNDSQINTQLRFGVPQP